MTYYQNMVFESIEVITHHTPEDMKILKFKWKNKVYKVSALRSKWTAPNAEMFDTHFVVICLEAKIVAELRYSHSDFKWELIQWAALPKGYTMADVDTVCDYKSVTEQ
jgi:hypothetical protein